MRLIVLILKLCVAAELVATRCPRPKIGGFAHAPGFVLKYYFFNLLCGVGCRCAKAKGCLLSWGARGRVSLCMGVDPGGAGDPVSGGGSTRVQIRLLRGGG